MRRSDLTLRLLVLALMGGSLLGGCTRDPFDRERPEKRYGDDYTYQDLLASEMVLRTAYTRTDGGRLAAAVAVGPSEVRVLEETAGAWTETAALSGSGLSTTMLDIAPGPLGGWWVLGGSSTEGARIYRVGGPGDSTLSVPVAPLDAAWDSTGSVIGGDGQGDFVAFLKERTQGLYRVTLADTGWTYHQVAGTSSGSRAYDVVVNGDSEHLLFQAIAGGDTKYWRDNGDSLHTSDIPALAENPALAVGPEDEAWALGVDSNQFFLRLWRQFDGSAWLMETIPMGDMNVFPSHFDLEITSDQRPNILISVFRGTERYDLLWGTRPAEVTAINWDLLPVVEDTPHEAYVNRQLLFGILLDGVGDPHILFATGVPGDFDSDMVEAVPRP
ncbi:MAG: hypothetical protein R6W82_03635 [bacterium]